MRRWGWFIAIWGQKPADGLVPVDDDDTENEEESDDVERWWGLWQADEIRKLADWIAIKNGFDGGKQPIESHGGAGAENTNSSGKADGRRSHSGTLPGHLTPLSDAFDTEDDEAGSEAEGAGAQMRVDEDGRVVPTQNELKTLVRGLREYAEVLDWRVWRMEDEPRPDGKENGAAKEKTTTKIQIRTVSPSNFY